MPLYACPCLALPHRATDQFSVFSAHACLAYRPLARDDAPIGQAPADTTSNPAVTIENLIADMLNAPLNPDWSIDGLAEQVLSAIAAQPGDESREFVMDGAATADRQTRRILRPLLACLANKSAAETGTPVNLYGGRLTFQRPGAEGPVWIVGQFDNRPGSARVTLRRSSSPPESATTKTALSRPEKTPGQVAHSLGESGMSPLR